MSDALPVVPNPVRPPVDPTSPTAIDKSSPVRKLYRADLQAQIDAVIATMDKDAKFGLAFYADNAPGTTHIYAAAVLRGQISSGEWSVAAATEWDPDMGAAFYAKAAVQWK